MVCAHEYCTATFQRVRWESNKKPSRASSLQIQNVETKAVVGVSFNTSDRAIEALIKKWLEENSVSVSDCGEVCLCLHDEPREDDYEYKDSSITAQFSSLDMNGRLVDYQVTYKVLRARLTVFGECAEEIADDFPLTFMQLGLLLEQQLSSRGALIFSDRPSLIDFDDMKLRWGDGRRELQIVATEHGVEESFHWWDIEAPSVAILRGPRAKPLTFGTIRPLVDAGLKFFKGDTSHLTPTSPSNARPPSRGND